MNISVIDVVKSLIAYLESKAVGDSDLEDHIYTHPQEERTNKYKKFIVLGYEVDPAPYELGDTQTQTIITFNIILGFRDNTMSLSGTEKELGDTFFYDYARYLRSREFRVYMAGLGIKVPPHHITREWHLDFDHNLEGLRKYNITLKLLTYIETLEDIP